MRVAKAAIIVAAGAMVTACGGYALPSAPRYPTRMGETPAPPPPQYPTTAETTTPGYEEPAGEAVLAPAPSRPVDAEALPPLGEPAAPPPETVSPGETPEPVSARLAPGVTYVVAAGDTLSGIGRRFGAPVQSLMMLNGLADGGIRPGDRIILPDGARDAGVETYASGDSPFRAPPAVRAETPPPSVPPTTPPNPPPPVQREGRPEIQTTGFPDAAELARRASGRFVWPVRGDLLTRFGTMGSGLRSDGVNIGAAAGTEVVAAAAGQVAYAGDSLPGLGTTVVIVHGDGWVTAYSHLGSTNVRMEQRVTQGQVIGTTGTTGGVSRPQVHFEIRYTPSPADRPRPVDPLPLLPR